MKTKTRTSAAELPLNSILDGDCIEIMQGLPESSVDLIFADDTWSGKLYTPKKGMTLDATLSLVSDDRLKLTVFFRGFTKDQYWSRTVLPE